MQVNSDYIPEKLIFLVSPQSRPRIKINVLWIANYSYNKITNRYAFKATNKWNQLFIKWRHSESSIIFIQKTVWPATKINDKCNCKQKKPEKQNEW